MGRFIVHTGEKVGRLTVLERSPINTNDNKPQWICKCECGNITTVCAQNLRKKHTLSCGCISKEITIKRNKENTKRNKYRTKGNYVELYTSNGVAFKIDKEDLENVLKRRWCQNSKGYIMASIDGKSVLLHRYLTNCPQKMVVDHINHDVTDNRRTNLRICTQYENTCNNIEFVFKGVYFDNKKLVWIAKHKKTIIGEYKNYKLAVIAKQRYLESIYGEYAVRKEEIEAYL